jgi:glycosyltransferase involved in cell wall biosynthesis
MKLSVIVATRNRAHVLRPCLESIAVAVTKAAPLDAEIVLVDNGSQDNTSAVAEQWASSAAVPLRLVYEPTPGLAVAHNRALRTAQGELLAFTDDDCRLTPEYVTDLLRHDAGDDAGLVLRGGRIGLGDPTDLPLTITTRSTRERWSLRLNSARHLNLGDSLAGCNMAMRRAVVERVGLFDECFGCGSPIGAGNDIEYVLRAYLAGVTIEYVPDMVVLHYHGRKTEDVGYKLLKNYMIGSGALYAKYLFRHPNFCRPFYWDMKHAIKELLTGSNTFLPAIGFSHRDKVAYAVRGAIRYFFMHKEGVPGREQYLPAHKNRAHESFTS